EDVVLVALDAIEPATIGNEYSLCYWRAPNGLIKVFAAIGAAGGNNCHGVELVLLKALHEGYSISNMGSQHDDIGFGVHNLLDKGCVISRLFWIWVGYQDRF